MAARGINRRLSLLLVTLLAATLIQASVYVYYPFSSRISAVAPPIIYVDPESANTQVSLGPNATSAAVVAKAQAGTLEISYNSGFDNNPNGWYFAPGTYLSSAVWLASASDGYTTEYGVIEVYGYLPRFTSDTAFILQYVTIPNASLSSLTATVTLFATYSGSGFGLLRFQVGLYDPDTSTTVWTSTTTTAPSTWSTYSYAIPASSVTPGKTYMFYISVNAFVLGFFGGGYAYFYIDMLQLNATLLNPYYTNVYLLANVTDGRTYESRLVLKSIDYTGAPNITIKLVNESNFESTPIVVSQGSVVSSSTSWIETPPTVAGYTSLRFHLDASIDAGTYANMTLLYQYRLGNGVIVTYPLQLNVTDPPPGNISMPVPPPGRHMPCPARLLAERLRRHKIVPIRMARGGGHG